MIATIVADRVATVAATAVDLVPQVAENAADHVQEALAVQVVLAPVAPAVKVDRVAEKAVQTIAGVNLTGTVLRSRRSLLRM